ncbi:MAG: nucleotidyltransferase domain-containing protein [Promethearchaeota archaeon]
MSKESILREHHLTVTYSKEKWDLLRAKRKRAIELLSMFEQYNPYVYGSVARGDVHRDSDIDIIILNDIPSFQIELILEKYGFNNYFREIIIATPQDSIRLYIHLNELECITLPLTRLERKNLQFYDFGGKVDLKQIKNDIRAIGIDKRLVMIKPIPKGHKELSIINNENVVAKEMGINIEFINERKNVLLRRERYGRTGVFFKRVIDMNESIEEVLKKIAAKHSIIRKKLYKK